MDSQVDLEEDSVEDLVVDSIKIIKIINKRSKEGTEIHSLTLE